MNKQSLTPAEYWLTQYGDALYRFALLRVKQSEAAEDLVQETLLAALKTQQNYAGSASTQTWLIGILKHKIIDYFRRQARRGTEVSDEYGIEIEQLLFDDQGHWESSGTGLPRPEDALQQTQFLAVLERCLERLPDRLAQLFILRELDGMDNDSLRQVLSIGSMNQLWVMMSRARLQLRHCIESQWLSDE